MKYYVPSTKYEVRDTKYDVLANVESRTPDDE